MTTNSMGEFAGYLLQKKYIARHSTSKLDFKDGDGGDKSLRKLWELTDLSANDFADEVARFYGLPRLTLPELLATTSLVQRFSRRVLRGMVVLPYQTADGRFSLALADPTDVAAIRAAEIVLGGPVEITVASFEDIPSVLAERLGEDDASPAEAGDATPQADNDIESLRDLAS